MTARQHHYVPQCYLKGFVRDRDQPKLFVVDLKERRTFTTNPKNVAVERDFHAVDVEGMPPDAFENDMSKFETALDNSRGRLSVPPRGWIKAMYLSGYLLIKQTQSDDTPILYLCSLSHCVCSHLEV
jgi:uncharacterized protein DUF4238